jgi:GxxExxY protein
MHTADAEGAEDAEDSLRPQPLVVPAELVHRDVTATVLRAFYTVYCELGFGFLEAVYSNALALLLTEAGLIVRREVPFEIQFRGQCVGNYRADLIVESRVIVEIKTNRQIVLHHTRQLLNYLRASKLEVGLLLNFGDRAEFKRVVNTRNPPR